MTTSVDKLPRGTVWIWLAPIKPSVRSIDASWSWLDGDERGRANRFYFDSDRADYVLSHGWLRRIIGEVSSQHPASLRFIRREANSKPVLLSADARALPLYFSLSHTRGYAAVAVSFQVEVGVDVECIRAIDSFERTLGGSLCEAERRRLRTFDGPRSDEFFFRLWTVKEAYTKALGLGLYHRFDQVCVDITTDGQAMITRSEGGQSLGACAYTGLIRPGERESPGLNGYAFSVSALSRAAVFQIYQVASDEVPESYGISNALRGWQEVVASESGVDMPSPTFSTKQ